MPLFDYMCEKCGDNVENEFVHKHDDSVKCEHCNVAMIKIFPSKVNVYSFPADGIYLEHVSPEGKTFHTKQEMKDYAKENKLELGAL